MKFLPHSWREMMPRRLPKLRLFSTIRKWCFRGMDKRLFRKKRGDKSKADSANGRGSDWQCRGGTPLHFSIRADGGGVPNFPCIFLGAARSHRLQPRGHRRVRIRRRPQGNPGRGIVKRTASRPERPAAWDGIGRSE